MADREQMRCEANPCTTITDSQSVKTTEADGLRGYDADKKRKVRKRHASVDVDGCALLVWAHEANIQDRYAGGPLLQMS